MLAFKPDIRYQTYWRHFRTGCFDLAVRAAESLSAASRGQEREFYLALGQVAESLHHLNQGDLEPADRLAQRAGIGLRPLGSSFHGVQLQALLLGLTACLEDARRSLDDQGCMQDMRLRVPRVDLALGLDPASTSD